MLRITIRSLTRTPLFTVTAIAALALGIGVNAAIFSALNAVLLRPSFMDDPAAIAVIGDDFTRHGLTARPTSNGTLLDAQVATHLFSHVVVHGWINFGYTPPGGTPVRVAGGAVSAGWFEAFGARPILGRTFRPSEQLPGNDRVVVLSYAAWQRLFGGEPGVLGRTMRLNGDNYEIIGVMPAEFRWPITAELWHPMTMRHGELASQPRLGGGWPLYVRLRPGVTHARAEAELQAAADLGFTPRERELAHESGHRVRVRSFLEVQATRTKVSFTPLVGAVFFVLLIACGNVAGLMLARGANRAGEMALRAALGAGRWQLMKPVLLESLLIATAGIVAGLAVAWALLRTLVAAAPPSEMPERLLRFDSWMLGFTIAAGALAGLLFGTMPAWQVAGLAASLGARGGASASRQRVRSALVVSEVALALVLLVGAGLFLRSLRNMQLIKPGFDTHALMTAELEIPAAPSDRLAQFHRAVVDRLLATPGVTAAASTSALPLLGGESRYPLSIPGRDLTGDPFVEKGRIMAMSRRVSPGYFAALGVRVLSGRSFTDGDVASSEPVLMVDEEFASRYFPGEDAVGRFLALGKKEHRIVGVAARVRQLEPGIVVARPLFYMPMYASPVPYAGFVLRGSGDLARALREAVAGVNPTLAVFNAQPLEERVYSLLSPQRIAAWLLAFFAASALFLAALGLYGVISYAVSQRTQEIGIRMALGARTDQVVRLVLSQGLRLALIGVAVGMLGALAVARALARQLANISEFDPVAFGGMAALLLVVAAAASWFPARRAAKVDPLVALRRE